MRPLSSNQDGSFESILNRVQVFQDSLELSKLSVENLLALHERLLSYAAGCVLTEANSRVKINQLPEESFLTICKSSLWPSDTSLCRLYGTIGVDNDTIRSQMRARLKTLLELSHVCRSWRQAIKTASPLWSFLQFDSSEDWIRHYSLENSGLAPLSLSVIPDLCDKDMINARMKARVVNLRLDADYRETPRQTILDCLDVIFPLHAPFLKSLTLDWPDDKHEPYIITDAHFSPPTASQLQALSLSWIYISFARPLPCLTHVYIAFKSNPPSFEDVFTFIASSPNIIFLFFVQAQDMCHASEEAAEGMPVRATLENLRTLHFLYCDWDFCSYLLDRISLPARAHIHLIECPSLHLTFNISTRLSIFTVATRMRISFHSTTTTFQFDGPPDSLDCMRPEGRLHVHQTTDDAGSEDEDSDNDDNDDELDIDSLLDWDSSGSPFPWITELHVRFGGDEPPKDRKVAAFLRLLERTPLLETLVVDFDATHGRPGAPCLPVLVPLFDALTADGPAARLCPLLRAITVSLESRIHPDSDRTVLQDWKTLMADRTVPLRGDTARPIEVLAEFMYGEGHRLVQTEDPGHADEPQWIVVEGPWNQDRYANEEQFMSEELKRINEFWDLDDDVQETLLCTY
ncbi:uncharacterized protein BXZ73DRAFT_101366 [Epithele typhae]|uniref:uncharacterized protein n=1 Tax=Epithele typhae TaxID=378194 RepID=UPI002008B804|nr:uncharacterized protein BXZ73DRAFT_101366 [Epithele typhae]KAH9932831.1 hypothetical protein BXZ73DRAFT_101366 [Epithele typhae]